MANNPRRKSDAARRANQVIRSRTVLIMSLLGVVTFLALFWKLYDLQIRQHAELQEKAVAQQTASTVVTASRGTIYDSGGNVLAESATAELIFLSPLEIQAFVDDQEDAIEEAAKEAEEKGESYTPPEVLDQSYIARGLSRILGLDEETILTKMEKTETQYQELVKKAEQDVADEVRRFINGEIDDEGNAVPEDQQRSLRGIFLRPNTKRYYRYGSLASNVLGFVNADNIGAYGLEAQYDSVLTGTAGLTVTAKNNYNQPLLFNYEQYYDAENGGNLVLTLDVNVQYYLEKGIESMVKKFDAKNGATGIVMDVNTGAIVAMASYPNYDPNDYSTVTDEKLLATLEGLTEGSKEYNEALGAAQLKQWRNKCYQDTYEPGSTFKPVTLATALEEGKVTMNTTFTCNGSIRVQGWNKPIYCSNHSGHGVQDLKTATSNSCNPAFITMGLKIGTQTYYQYLKSFGFMESTGVDLPAEVGGGIFASEKDFNSNVVSLASYSFGQTFNITPLQLIRAQAATINGGYLYTPYLVDQILDDDGNIISQHESVPVRQVVSEETSAKVRECLEYVVSSGTGRNGPGPRDLRMGGRGAEGAHRRTAQCALLQPAEGVRRPAAEPRSRALRTDRRLLRVPHRRPRQRRRRDDPVPHKLRPHGVRRREGHRRADGGQGRPEGAHVEREGHSDNEDGPREVPEGPVVPRSHGGVRVRHLRIHLHWRRSSRVLPRLQGPWPHDPQDPGRCLTCRG